MNTQTVSQVFRSAHCFVREIFEEMFHSNLKGYVDDAMFVFLLGTEVWGPEGNKTFVIELAVKSM